MSYTVTIGWWLIPALITAATIIYGLMPVRNTRYGGDITILVNLMMLVIFNLVAWLIWAFAR